MKNYKSIIALVAAGLACTAAQTQASLVNGYVWENASSSWESLALPAGTVPTAPPSTALAAGTLDGNGSLDFTSVVGANWTANYTIASFLATGGYNFTANAGFSGNDDLNNTLFEFTGQTFLTTGQTISVWDDDGIILNINGSTVLSEPQPQSDHGYPWTATWTGATGEYSFDLFYAEVLGAPAELSADISVVPESSTVVAGALMLLPFGIGAVRSMRKDRNV